jgi:hypothetical protein
MIAAFAPAARRRWHSGSLGLVDEDERPVHKMAVDNT